MLSPSLSRITNRMRSSISELTFHGIHFPPPSRGKSVTHVSGTFCYLCVEPHKGAWRLALSPKTWTGSESRLRPEAGFADLAYLLTRKTATSDSRLGRNRIWRTP